MAPRGSTNLGKAMFVHFHGTGAYYVIMNKPCQFIMPPWPSSSRMILISISLAIMKVPGSILPAYKVFTDGFITAAPLLGSSGEVRTLSGCPSRHNPAMNYTAGNLSNYLRHDPARNIPPVLCLFHCITSLLISGPLPIYFLVSPEECSTS